MKALSFLLPVLWALVPVGYSQSSSPLIYIPDDIPSVTQKKGGWSSIAINTNNSKRSFTNTPLKFSKTFNSYNGNNGFDAFLRDRYINNVLPIADKNLSYHWASISKNDVNTVTAFLSKTKVLLFGYIDKINSSGFAISKNNNFTNDYHLLGKSYISTPSVVGIMKPSTKPKYNDDLIDITLAHETGHLFIYQYYPNLRFRKTKTKDIWDAIHDSLATYTEFLYMKEKKYITSIIDFIQPTTNGTKYSINPKYMHYFLMGLDYDNPVYNNQSKIEHIPFNYNLLTQADTLVGELNRNNNITPKQYKYTFSSGITIDLKSNSLIPGMLFSHLISNNNAAKIISSNPKFVEDENLKSALRKEYAKIILQYISGNVITGNNYVLGH